jgi:hypothetical protein
LSSLPVAGLMLFIAISASGVERRLLDVTHSPIRNFT